MKKLISAILILLMLTPAALAAPDGMVFCLTDGVAAGVGETVTLTARVENAPACSSFRVFFTYDTGILEYVEHKQLNTRGIFILNPNANYENKPAFSALAADAGTVFEGNSDLFSITFKLKADPAGKDLIQLAYSEFYSADLEKLEPTLKVGTIRIGAAPAENPPAAKPDEKPALPEGSWEIVDDQVTVEDASGNKTEFETAPDYREPEKGETVTTPIFGEDQTQAGTVVIEKDENGTLTVTPMKPLPNGSWTVTDKEIMVMDPEGNATVYKTEYEEPENGGSAQAPLYDQNGKPVGSVTIEKDENGNRTVTPNDPAGSVTPKAENGFPFWIVWVAAAIALGGGTAAIIAIILKKKKDRLD